MAAMLERDDEPGLALKIGIAGAIGLGAIVSGMLISRRGRNLVREAWQGRRRSRIEDRVLDGLWGDDDLGRRDIEVEEVEEGVIALSGRVRGQRERRRALVMAERVRDVQRVIDNLVVDPAPRRRRPRRPPTGPRIRL
jgi:hypothetical protein